MIINDLVIETTRKCNMSCYHCLRGEPQKMMMKKEYIDSLLYQVDEIGSVCFTGGEPTLNLPIMEYFLKSVQDKNIMVNNFYIVTNGLKVTEEFVLFCLKMYSYCDDKEQCSVQVSNDYPHQIEGEYNIELLDGLKFFSKKFEKDNYNYGRDSFLKPEGRAKKIGGGVNIVPDLNNLDEDDLSEITYYLNCKGEIINGCDWSYESQSKNKICDVGKLSEFYYNIKNQFEEVE